MVTTDSNFPSLKRALLEIYKGCIFPDAPVGSASISWVILSKLQSLCSLSNRGNNNGHIPLNTCNHPLIRSMNI